MASVKEDNFLNPYRKLLVDLSFDLSKKDVETLKLASVDIIPRRITENIATGLHLFDVLEQDGRIGPRNLDLLQDMLKTVGRVDLARKIQAFLTRSLKGGTGKIRSLNTISVKQKTNAVSVIRFCRLRYCCHIQNCQCSSNLEGYWIPGLIGTLIPTESKRSLFMCRHSPRLAFLRSGSFRPTINI